MVLLFEKVVALATRKGQNEGVNFAILCKCFVSIVARAAMMTQTLDAVHKQEQDDVFDL